MKNLNRTIALLLALIGVMCSAAKQSHAYPTVVYETENVTISQVSNNTFEHTSYLHTNDFGVVPGNGLIVRDKGEVIIFNTPADDKSAQELIRWVKNTLHCKINAVIPTHFHQDCLGGLKTFHDQGIPSYANVKTLKLAKRNKVVVPQNGFKKSLTLMVGDKKIIARFFGEGHTRDNIVGYFPSENVLFGGCLIKEIGASKGNLEDANVEKWSATVEKVKKAYPSDCVIIPGHGKQGDTALLDYTIALFKTQ